MRALVLDQHLQLVVQCIKMLLKPLWALVALDLAVVVTHTVVQK